ncbi:GNAT family N-acetyltransferase [Winogradskyella vidalii]|uniref:GNAT family N-acetyltransferase n=1 Tax=Winogradskyella vidalii TaxID=2615024 RepID=UPI0015C6A45B|nr:N-acetyltransferase [Winogradskyella vidalii]
MVVIRQASLEDLKAVHTIEELSFKDGSYPLFVLRQFFDIAENYFLVAEDAGVILGYALGNISIKNNQGWLLSLGVHPKARGKQIGKQLVEKIVTLLEQGHCNEICLTVHPYNRAAINIYKHLNFKIVSESNNYYLDNEKRLLMVKQVRSLPLNYLNLTER